jgi:hypothetical protein
MDNICSSVKVLIYQEGGGVAIVQMSSRNSTSLRFRSNRLSYSNIEYTSPPTSDRGINYFQTVSKSTGNIYAHAGAMQAYGNYLIVPAESKISGNANSINSEVLFYDVSNPAAPIQLNYSLQRNDTKAGTAAIARIADGRYIVMAEGDRKLDFYISSTTSLSASDTQFSFFASWQQNIQGLQAGSVDYNFGNNQSYTFIAQCDGALFLTASNNNSPIAGGISFADFLDLYRVTLFAGNPNASMLKVGKKNMYCADSAPRNCNFAAAGGMYITHSGDFIFYATEHFNDGPAATVKFSEFATEQLFCPTLNDAWVELFDDDTYRDRTVFVDFADRNLRRYDNFKYLEGFNDKTSSARWCIPAGWAYRLYRDNTYGGSFYTLTGSGIFNAISNLDLVGFGDALSSSKFTAVSTSGGSGGSSGGGGCGGRNCQIPRRHQK